MDSTHKTNFWKWRLFTITVRDQYGAWIPAAQFIVEKEDSVSVGEALRHLRALVPEWEPQFFVVDDSAVEQNGIKIAFPGTHVF